jgi:hypothetical protein
MVPEMLTLDLEAVAPPPNLPVKAGVSSLRLWLPCRVSPLNRCEHPPPPKDCSFGVGMLAPSEVTVPYRVFPVWGSSVTPRFPDRAALKYSKTEVSSTVVAPSGFRTLSTLCSPPDLPSLFHPGPASGVHPSRLCSAMSAVRASRPARTLLRFLTLCRIAFDPRETGWLGYGPCLSRALLTHRSQRASSGYCTIRRPCCLHGLVPSEVCSGLVRWAESPVPLSRFAGLSLRSCSRTGRR